MPRQLRRRTRVTLFVLITLPVILVVTAVVLVQGSFAILDGERELTGLDAPVTVSRDHLGIPDIEASSRHDAARSLGYLHAQDRFFQMDLQRRSAAGELAALMGSALLDTDREARVHQFRTRAAAAVAAMPANHRSLLGAYTDGVNAGLDDLRVRPVEYLALRHTPLAWKPEDCVLTLHAMFLDLNVDAAITEGMWSTLRNELPAPLAEFLLPWSNPWNAPLGGELVPGITIPDSNDVDVRQWKFADKTWQELRDDSLQMPRQDTAGSNNWVVAGSRTKHGGAIVANDMHLRHGLPNIWYRARMSWPEGDGLRSLVGVTLPGTPAFAVGSNGQVAWGFTNSQGDWADNVILELSESDSTRYRTPSGWRTIERTAELIAVNGADVDTLWVESTIWGPIWDTDSKGRRLALRWTAHDTDAVNLGLLSLETAMNVHEVVAIAGGFGIPAQNVVCADNTGEIAWVLAGRIPNRFGWDGRTSVSWADGEHGWDGYIKLSEQPKLVAPPDGQIWTANNQVATGDDLRLIGDGGYALGARAAQIRDNLTALGNQISEEDMLAVALDDRALMLEHWRELALTTLGRSGENDSRQPFIAIVADNWSGRAEPSSASYRLVRDFMYNCIDNVYDLLVGSLAEHDDFRTSWLPYRHAITWELIAEKPAHLLAPQFADWDALVVDAVDQTIEAALAIAGSLEEYRWGDRNQVKVEHPMVFISAQLARWLAAPQKSLPGDAFMPRVQHPRHGASERMVVSPGREQEAFMHMPGGQSGHPWSPYFLAGHEAWEKGEPTPLLPGPAKHRLTLIPPQE